MSSNGCVSTARWTVSANVLRMVIKLHNPETGAGQTPPCTCNFPLQILRGLRRGVRVLQAHEQRYPYSFVVPQPQGQAPKCAEQTQRVPCAPELSAGFRTFRNGVAIYSLH